MKLMKREITITNRAPICTLQLGNLYPLSILPLEPSIYNNSNFHHPQNDVTCLAAAIGIAFVEGNTRSGLEFQTRHYCKE